MRITLESDPFRRRNCELHVISHEKSIAVILESSWNRLTEVLLKNLPPLMAIAQETHVIFGGSTLLLMAISPFHPEVDGLMVLDTRTIFMQDIGQDVFFFFLKNSMEKQCGFLRFHMDLSENRVYPQL